MELQMTIENNEGFGTPTFEDEPEYKGIGGHVIHPKLCDKIKEYDECPYNMHKEACLDCDVILTNSEEHGREMDISFVDDE